MGKICEREGGGKRGVCADTGTFFLFFPYPPNCNVLVVPLLQHCDKKCVKGGEGKKEKKWA